MIDSISVDFNVPNESVSISINKSNEPTPIFNKTFTDINVEGWGINYTFMKRLKILFKKLENSYSTNK